MLCDCVVSTRTLVGWGIDTTAPSQSPEQTVGILQPQRSHTWCCQRRETPLESGPLLFAAGSVLPCGTTHSCKNEYNKLTNWSTVLYLRHGSQWLVGSPRNATWRVTSIMTTNLSTPLFSQTPTEVLRLPVACSLWPLCLWCSFLAYLEKLSFGSILKTYCIITSFLFRQVFPFMQIFETLHINLVNIVYPLQHIFKHQQNSFVHALFKHFLLITILILLVRGYSDFTKQKMLKIVQKMYVFKCLH